MTEGKYEEETEAEAQPFVSESEREFFMEALLLGRRRLFEIWALASRNAAELHDEGRA